ncbi:signal peptidase complex subunit 3 [Elysia marginata]|uniref:Signal peptidase complex subunit 3 n=1 Tax=Elysia marginata TaxID=1093978 RepID=A0AAV4EAS7_9GAST|nr:signal peptidase complex subunit 3 [Elysia marginata]
MLFLYLTAEYKTKDHELNQVVLWDKIVKRGENTILDFRKANTKYYFWDYGNGLKGNENVTLTLQWNVIPNAGTLPNVKGSGSQVYRLELGSARKIWESFPPHTEQLPNHELLLAHSLWASQGLIAPWESLGLVARWALSGQSEAGIPLTRMTLGKRGASENLNAMAR